MDFIIVYTIVLIVAFIAIISKKDVSNLETEIQHKHLFETKTTMDIYIEDEINKLSKEK